MAEPFSKEHLNGVVTQNLTYGAVILDRDPELELLSNEIGFKLDPELYIILKDFSDISGKPIDVILQEAFKYAPEEAILKYQAKFNLTWDEACNIILGDYLEISFTTNMPASPPTNDPTPISPRTNIKYGKGVSNPEYEPKIVYFSLSPDLIQFLQGYHGFMMFEGHTSHSIEEDIYFAIDNYPIDIDPQEQQGLLDIQQTTSASEQNFSVKLNPEQIAKIAIIATNLKCGWSNALNLMIAHLKENIQKDPELIERIRGALTKLSNEPFSPPSAN